MGLIIGVGQNKPTFPYDYYYGVEWDTTAAASAITRVGKAELHAACPIQNAMRRCLLDDAGNVVTYLGATDSTKTDTGAAADLSGASGQVMVEIPEHYRKFEVDGTKIRCLLSQHQLPGFIKVPKMYRSAYQATVDRTNSKLASVVNNTAQYRGGNNDASKDTLSGSQLGMPAAALSLTTFRTYARARGAAGRNNKGWNCDLYEAQKATYWLYVVEYANFNCQLAFNAQPDANGYRQGGLGDGVTNADGAKWNAMAGYYPFIPCGVTNSLGNASGVVTYNLTETQASGYGNAASFSVPSYHGIENPFGHIWHHTDGVKVKIQSEAAGGKSILYTCDDPAKFQDTDYTDYVQRGELPRTSGYPKSLLVGEFGENIPKTVGGSSTTYMSDYFYTDIPASGEAQRAVLFGGSAHNGAFAGLSYANTNRAPSNTYANVGSRLCFLPE